MTKIVMYTTNWCSDCLRSKRLLNAHSVEFTEINIEDNPEFVPVVLALTGGLQSVPTIIIHKSQTEKTVLVEPTDTQLLAALN